MKENKEEYYKFMTTIKERLGEEVATQQLQEKLLEERRKIDASVKYFSGLMKADTIQKSQEKILKEYRNGEKSIRLTAGTQPLSLWNETVWLACFSTELYAVCDQLNHAK